MPSHEHIKKAFLTFEPVSNKSKGFYGCFKESFMSFICPLRVKLLLGVIEHLFEQDKKSAAIGLLS